MREIRIGTAAAIAMMAALLVGCADDPYHRKADTGTVIGAVAGGIIGSTVGRGSGRVAATAIGAVAGGIIGNEIGRGLDQRDRLLAERAELDALESGPSGRPVRWRNSGTGRYGDVVPGEPFRRGSLDCREYTHTVFIDARPRTMRGVACRNPDGTWSDPGRA